MHEWFAELAQVQNPTREHLRAFLAEVILFLDHALHSEESSSIWGAFPQLLQLALLAYETDVITAARELSAAIGDIPDRDLVRHGLVGHSARFKFNVIAYVSRAWNRARGQFTVRAGFKRVVEAIDGPLGSLVDAARVGGAIKEFKDAVLALTPEK